MITSYFNLLARKPGQAILVYLLIWAGSLTAAFLMSAFGIHLLGDPQSIKIAGEMSNFGIFTACISTVLSGSILMLRKA